MKKNNVALWGTGFVGAFICILIDSNYAATANSGIGWLGLTGGIVALICAYLFFNEAFKMLLNETGEKNQEELTEEEFEAQKERKRQERLEKKLDELILVEKAVYTMLKKEIEVNEAAYENMGNQLQEMTDKVLNSQQTAMKAIIKYNRDDIQGATKAVTGELLKLQDIMNGLQSQLLDVTEGVRTEIQNQTEVMDRSLGNLEESIQNINISVAAPVMETTPKLMEAPVEAAVSSEDVLLGASIAEDSFLEDNLEEMEVPELENVEDILAAVEDEPEEIDFPEDIMAMIEPEEELVVEEPEPVEPAPVMDDPNRAMTPDEIAALIASMN